MRRHGNFRLLAGAVGVAIAGVVFFYFLPKLAGYAEVWRVVRSLSLSWILVLAGVTALNLLSNAPPWMAALPGLGLLSSLRVALGSSALSIVAPAGGAVSVATQFAMLKGWGLAGTSIRLATALVNIAGQLVTYALPLIAIAGLAAEGGHNKSLDLAALFALLPFTAIAAVFALGLASRPFARRSGDLAAAGVSRLKRLVRKGPVRWSGGEFVQHRDEAVALLRRRWHVLTFTTLASQLSVFCVLLVSLRAVGIASAQVTLVEAFAGWNLIRTLGKIPITPGGLGVEEIALAGALIGFGAGHGAAVSATLIYRFLTVVPTLVLGLVIAVTYRMLTPQAASSPGEEPDYTT